MDHSPPPPRAPLLVSSKIGQRDQAESIRRIYHYIVNNSLIVSDDDLVYFRPVESQLLQQGVLNEMQLARLNNVKQRYLSMFYPDMMDLSFGRRKRKSIKKRKSTGKKKKSTGKKRKTSIKKRK